MKPSALHLPEGLALALQLQIKPDDRIFARYNLVPGIGIDRLQNRLVQEEQTRYLVEPDGYQ